MPRLFTDANPTTIAYYIEDWGKSGYQNLPRHYTIMEAEYMAVMYGLNEYFLAWNKEVDARQDDLDTERLRATGEEKFYHVATPSQETKRELPPPVLVLSGNEAVVMQLAHHYHIGKDSLRKLAQQIWQQTENVEVKFQWVPRSDNIAGKMLR